MKVRKFFVDFVKYSGHPFLFILAVLLACRKKKWGTGVLAAGTVTASVFLSKSLKLFFFAVLIP